MRIVVVVTVFGVSTKLLYVGPGWYQANHLSKLVCDQQSRPTQPPILRGTEISTGQSALTLCRLIPLVDKRVGGK